jgi:hypothetical protein
VVRSEKAPGPSAASSEEIAPKAETSPERQNLPWLSMLQLLGNQDLQRRERRLSITTGWRGLREPIQPLVTGSVGSASARGRMQRPAACSAMRKPPVVEPGPAGYRPGIIAGCRIMPSSELSEQMFGSS